MTKKKRKGINSKDKGDRAERAVAKLFTAWWGSDFTRTPGSGGFATKQFRDDWNAAGDLVTPDETFPFTVEVKHNEGWEMRHLLTGTDKSLIWQFWQQCLDETKEGDMPLLVFTKNHQPWFYMMLEPDYTRRSFSHKYLVATDPNHCAVVVGLLNDLFHTDKEIWL